MTRSSTLLPDGTRCYTGPTCKKHGAQAQKTANTAKAQKLQADIGSLLSGVSSTKQSTKPTYPPKPDWWTDYTQQNFKYNEEIFQRFGLKEAFVPTFHDNAMQYGYIAVETGEKDTQLIVGKDGSHYKQGEKHYCRAWMYKNGKPVAMLRFATYPKDYVPGDGQYPYAESTICDIEVREGYAGNGYGLEVIRKVEKNILAGRLIHSGGSYTPEGHRSLGGKLPYTQEAKMTYKKQFSDGTIPQPSFRSMKFVHDWDMLQTIS